MDEQNSVGPVDTTGYSPDWPPKTTELPQYHPIPWTDFQPGVYYEPPLVTVVKELTAAIKVLTDVLRGMPR